MPLANIIGHNFLFEETLKEESFFHHVADNSYY